MILQTDPQTVDSCWTSVHHWSPMIGHLWLVTMMTLVPSATIYLECPGCTERRSVFTMKVLPRATISREQQWVQLMKGLVHVDLYIQQMAGLLDSLQSTRPCYHHSSFLVGNLVIHNITHLFSRKYRFLFTWFSPFQHFLRSGFEYKRNMRNIWMVMLPPLQSRQE